MSKPAKKKPVQPKNIKDTAIELAKIMNKDPDFVEDDTLQKGENLVGLFFDTQYTDRRFKGLTEQKVEVLKQAISDISSGVMTLRTSSIGVSYKAGKMVTYVSPLGSLPEGTVVFSVNWKNIAAFKNWRHGEEVDVPQEDVNAAVYRLTYEISKLLPKSKSKDD